MIINLEEFADLCGVTQMTMRAHLRGVDDSPPWLVERGDRGQAYKIDADGGLAWWRAKRDAGDQVSAERQEALRQLRFDHLGDAVETADELALSGRQRREEYAAALERIKLRRVMGELVEVAELEPKLMGAAIELRRRLLLVPSEFGATTGSSPDELRVLRDLIERVVNDFVDSMAPAKPAPSSDAGDE